MALGEKNKVRYLTEFVSIALGMLLLSISIYGKWFYEYTPVPAERWRMARMIE